MARMKKGGLWPYCLQTAKLIKLGCCLAWPTMVNFVALCGLVVWQEVVALRFSVHYRIHSLWGLCGLHTCSNGRSWTPRGFAEKYALLWFLIGGGQVKYSVYHIFICSNYCSYVGS